MAPTTNSDAEKEKINLVLYDEIYKDALLLHQQETTGAPRSAKNFMRLFTIAEAGGNMNEVTDVYLYEGLFSGHTAELIEVMLHAILSMIASRYNSDNLKYLEQIIQDDKSDKGQLALQFYFKIGKVHAEHEAQLLEFIGNVYAILSPGQKDLTVHCLNKFFSKNHAAQKMVRESGMLEMVANQVHAEQIAEKNRENSDIPLAENKTKVRSKPWWKF